jgi:hypothetical protein
MISQVARFGDTLNIHGILPKLYYGKIIEVFGKFKLLGFYLHIWSLDKLVILECNSTL